MNSAPTRPGVLTEQVQLLRRLECARATFLREYHELPGNTFDGDFRRLRNAKNVKEGTAYVYYRYDGPKGVWARISEEEFDVELDRRVAQKMHDECLGPYAGGS